MLAIAFVGVLTIGGVSAAVAQGPNMDPAQQQERMEKRLERMSDRLELSPQQQTKIRGVITARRENVRDIRADESLDRQEKRSALKELRKTSRTEIESYLNDAQKVEFREMKQNRKDRRGKAMKRGKRLKKALDLTDEQSKEMRVIMKDARAERRLIIEAAEGDREAARPELKAHRLKTKEKVRAILTPEQIEKFDKMKERRGKRGDRGNRGKRGNGPK